MTTNNTDIILSCDAKEYKQRSILSDFWSKRSNGDEDIVKLSSLAKQGSILSDLWRGLPFHFTLVGTGVKGEKCGVLDKSHICNNKECGKVHYSHIKCKRKMCPDCFKFWMWDESEIISARLLSQKVRAKNEGLRLVSVILSAKQKDFVSREDLNRWIRDGYKYIMKKGAVGGVAIFHPFRATKEAKRKSVEANMKTWQWVRAQPNPGRFCSFSPHLHLLCYVGEFKKPEKGEKWIYKNKNENFLAKAKRDKDIKGWSDYLLSHTGDIGEGDFHAIRWFGSCSRVSLKVTEEEKDVKSKKVLSSTVYYCKKCGSELTPFWRWIREHYNDMHRGDFEPYYWKEIIDGLNGDDPPGDAKDYIVE